MEKAVYTPVTKLLDYNISSCRQKTVYEFLQELRRLKLFPSLELMAAKTSLNVIIDRLSEFGYEPERHPEEPCICKDAMGYGEVASIGEKHGEYFDGLCLDCIAKPKKKEHPQDSREFKLHAVTRDWDRGCRVRHGEPTWYFSYHAREERRRFGA